jgi:hypothetical protein
MPAKGETAEHNLISGIAERYLKDWLRLLLGYQSLILQQTRDCQIVRVTGSLEELGIGSTVTTQESWS